MDPATAGFIYWYLCGSDLESNAAAATTDLQEMLQVTLPENVKVVIQTGGAKKWQNDQVKADRLQRYEYSGNTLELKDEADQASMGDPATLKDFLKYGEENYQADHKMLLFWNHGGGSVSGVSFDENYDADSLTLDELSQAMKEVYGDKKALEVVGFDTCLMATLDTANVFQKYARYMVASEETEPGNGWLYSGWLGSLAKDPSMDGAKLGKAICDSFVKGCKEVGTDKEITLSVTDLSKTVAITSAVRNMGKVVLQKAEKDTSVCAEFARSAGKSENYGGNTREQGYTNMVDLGHMARQSTGLLQTAGDVLNALEDCVLYRVSGPYRAESTGLSCYYSYNGDLNDLYGYTNVGAGQAFKYFYSYELTGQLDDNGMEYISGMNYEELPQIQSLAAMGWDGMPLQVDEDGVSHLTLGPEADSILAGIGFSLYYFDEENDIMLLLGTDNDMNADWENGVFSDNFRGVWGGIDGHMVYMELCFEGEDYNLYSVPVLLNGEPYNLQVAYDFTTEEWSILGARQGIGEAGMSDKELRLLQPGDALTTIWYLSSYSGEDGLEAYAVEELTVTADTSFAEMELPDGRYGMVFEMRDAMDNYAYSDSVFFLCEDGKISTLIYE